MNCASAAVPLDNTASLSKFKICPSANPSCWLRWPPSLGAARGLGTMAIAGHCSASGNWAEKECLTKCYEGLAMAQLPWHGLPALSYRTAHGTAAPLLLLLLLLVLLLAARGRSEHQSRRQKVTLRMCMQHASTAQPIE